MNIHKLRLPLATHSSSTLKAGDKVLLSGTLYTARDMAHKRLAALIAAGNPLPWDLSEGAL
ncbi:MAG: fumarate hydratase C-terminal domain-containing protein, partial [Candidatus Cloacimonetes bacterium]|nr:fumarate hydratase C-terminal domain-containing protein [Candidatus Cloacimonadota bacterium]